MENYDKNYEKIFHLGKQPELRKFCWLQRRPLTTAWPKGAGQGKRGWAVEVAVWLVSDSRNHQSVRHSQGWQVQHGRWTCALALLGRSSWKWCCKRPKVSTTDKKRRGRTYLLFGEGRLVRDSEGLEKFMIALGTDLKQTVNPLISLHDIHVISEMWIAFG